MPFRTAVCITLAGFWIGLGLGAGSLGFDINSNLVQFGLGVTWH